MTTDDAPRGSVLACPDARVTERAVDNRPTHFNPETRAKRSDRDIRTDSPNVKLLRFVRAKTNRTCGVCVEIRRLRSDAAIGASEQELVRDESIERRDVGVQLRVANPCFALDDLRVG
jgi:hypothetical protein